MTPRIRKGGWREGELHCSRVRYWGDQDGPRAQEFKIALSVFFRTRVEIQTAYFAKLGFNDDPPSTVALCIRALYDPNVAPINRRIGEIYAPLFKGGGTMEIIYLSEKSDRIVQQVCQPFYERYSREFQHRWAHLKQELRHGRNGHRYGSNGHGSNRKNGHNGNGHGHHSHGHGDAMYLRDTDQPFGKFTVNGNGNGNGVHREGAEGANGNGHQENGPNGNGHHPAEDADPIRLYLPLLPGRIHPVEIALYYECLGCGVILSSAAPGDTKCRCGNIAIHSGVVAIQDLAQAHAFRQT